MNQTKQQIFTNLNHANFCQEFKLWLSEYERRLNFLTNNQEIPAQTSQALWKELTKYPRSVNHCFFCQKTRKDQEHFFFFNHGDFWGCQGCYEKYTKLTELTNTIKWELAENERKFPAGWHCAVPCESKTELDCCNCCSCPHCPKEKVWKKKLARFRIKEGKVSKYDQLIIAEELAAKQQETN